MIKIMTFCLLSICNSVLIALPVVTSVSPTNGSVSGGTTVTVTGSGFTGATEVDFGTVSVPFTVISDTTITTTAPPGVAGTVDIKVKSGSQTSPISRADFFTFTQVGWRGIISAQTPNELVLFNTATNTVSNIVGLPQVSQAAIITPDGKHLYLANQFQATVTVIDVATLTIIDTIPTPIGGVSGFDIIVSPSGDKVYVSHNISGYVTVIDTATNSVAASIFVSPNLGSLGLTPDGKTLYAANFSSTGVYSIDTTTNTVGPFILTGVTPGAITFTHNGSKAYVANADLANVSVIDVATSTVIQTISLPAGSRPYGSCLIPNGTDLFVGDLSANSVVWVIDTITDTLSTTIPFPAGTAPFWVAPTPDSKDVYALNLDTDNVIDIDVATLTPGSPFGFTSSQYEDMVMSPDPAPVAVFTVQVMPVNTPTLFDASGSISPIGTIVNYFWDFGDGTTVSTSSPLVSHTYRSSKSYAATLTVTNSAGTSTTQVYSSRFMSNNGSTNAIVSETLGIPEAVVQTCCRFLSQTDIINVITWEPSNFVAPVAAYHIYRNSALTDLAGTVNSHTLTFADHNRHPGKTYTYYIVAVSTTGIPSSPFTISVKPRC